jgi:hypothetical protein
MDVSLPEQSEASLRRANRPQLPGVHAGTAAAIPLVRRRTSEDAMNRENPSSSNQLFRSSRRWSPLPFILSGVLLVAGYVGASAVLIDNYSNHTAPVGGPRA